MQIKENLLIEALAKSGNEELQKAFLAWQEARIAKNELFANEVINLFK